MKVDNFSQMIYSEKDIFNSIMRNEETLRTNYLVENISQDEIDIINNIANDTMVIKYIPKNIGIEEFDFANQENWYMPNEYKELDIAKYILSLCNTPEELQRCAEELFLYQEKKLFNLLRYLKYLVDIMQENNIIWGVGRGSSVSSYILFKLRVHKIDSIYYNLSVSEFLR